jgi:hypothetical protein
MKEMEQDAMLPGLYPPDSENKAHYETTMRRK